MTWLDVITPIPKTLIPDDERRQGVNRGFLSCLGRELKITLEYLSLR